MKKNERTKLMQENFMKLHKEGKSIAEIAEECQVSKYTIYENLQEIADKNGVTREELLTRVHKEHEMKNGRVTTHYAKVDQEKLKNDFDDTINNINNIINTIADIVK